MENENTEIENAEVENIEKENIEEAKSENKESLKSNDTKPKKAKPEEEKKSFAREAFEWIGCILVAFFLAIFIKYFIFTPTQVKMSSMYPTIYSNERVFVNRLVRTFGIEVKRGDIITFEAPKNEDLKNREPGDYKATYYDREGWSFFVNNVLEMGSDKISYIKRVIGVSGDTIRFVDGYVYVNGELLDESEYLPDGTITNPTKDGLPEEFTVPEGYIFAMGDNRRGSKDCRAFGCIPVSKIEGRVEFRIWPLTKFGKITKADVTIDDLDY